MSFLVNIGSVLSVRRVWGRAMPRGVWLRGWLVVLLVAGMGWASFHVGPFLSTPQHRPVASDLLVILGGGLGERARMGADLYRDGFAPRILLTGVADTGETTTSPEPFFRLPYLRFRGVPPDATIVDSEADSTWEEAWLIRRLCLEHEWRRVLLVSDPPHFRRLAWSLARATEGTGIDWRLVPAEAPWWNGGAWWSDLRAAEFVGKEIFKLAYYLIRYGVGFGE